MIDASFPSATAGSRSRPLKRKRAIELAWQAIECDDAECSAASTTGTTTTTRTTTAVVVPAPKRRAVADEATTAATAALVLALASAAGRRCNDDDAAAMVVYGGGGGTVTASSFPATGIASPVEVPAVVREFLQTSAPYVEDMRIMRGDLDWSNEWLATRAARAFDPSFKARVEAYLERWRTAPWSTAATLPPPPPTTGGARSRSGGGAGGGGGGGGGGGSGSDGRGYVGCRERHSLHRAPDFLLQDEIFRLCRPTTTTVAAASSSTWPAPPEPFDAPFELTDPRYVRVAVGELLGASTVILQVIARIHQVAATGTGGHGVSATEYAAAVYTVLCYPFALSQEGGMAVSRVVYAIVEENRWQQSATHLWLLFVQVVDALNSNGNGRLDRLFRKRYHRRGDPFLATAETDPVAAYDGPDVDLRQLRLAFEGRYELEATDDTRGKEEEAADAAARTAVDGGPLPPTPMVLRPARVWSERAGCDRFARLLGKMPCSVCTKPLELAPFGGWPCLAMRGSLRRLLDAADLRAAAGRLPRDVVLTPAERAMQADDVAFANVADLTCNLPEFHLFHVHCKRQEDERRLVVAAAAFACDGEPRGGALAATAATAQEPFTRLCRDGRIAAALRQRRHEFVAVKSTCPRCLNPLDRFRRARGGRASDPYGDEGEGEGDEDEEEEEEEEEEQRDHRHRHRPVVADADADHCRDLTAFVDKASARAHLAWQLWNGAGHRARPSSRGASGAAARTAALLEPRRVEETVARFEDPRWHFPVVREDPEQDSLDATAALVGAVHGVLGRVHERQLLFDAASHPIADVSADQATMESLEIYLHLCFQKSSGTSMTLKSLLPVADDDDDAFSASCDAYDDAAGDDADDSTPALTVAELRGAGAHLAPLLDRDAESRRRLERVALLDSRRERPFSLEDVKGSFAADRPVHQAREGHLRCTPTLRPDWAGLSVRCVALKLLFMDWGRGRGVRKVDGYERDELYDELFFPIAARRRAVPSSRCRPMLEPTARLRATVTKKETTKKAGETGMAGGSGSAGSGGGGGSDSDGDGIHDRDGGGPVARGWSGPCGCCGCGACFFMEPATDSWHGEPLDDAIDCGTAGVVYAVHCLDCSYRRLESTDGTLRSRISALSQRNTRTNHFLADGHRARIVGLAAYDTARRRAALLRRWRHDGLGDDDGGGGGGGGSGGGGDRSGTGAFYPRR